MKRTHIIILIFIALAISVLVSFMGNLSTYETIASARQKSGKTVTIIAKLDNSQPIEFDAQKNPNYTIQCIIIISFLSLSLRVSGNARFFESLLLSSPETLVEVVVFSVDVD